MSIENSIFGTYRKHDTGAAAVALCLQADGLVVENLDPFEHTRLKQIK